MDDGQPDVKRRQADFRKVIREQMLAEVVREEAKERVKQAV
jgi:hypothetical protein